MTAGCYKAHAYPQFGKESFVSIPFSLQLPFEPIFVYLEMNEDTSCNGGDNNEDDDNNSNDGNDGNNDDDDDDDVVDGPTVEAYVDLGKDSM